LSTNQTQSRQNQEKSLLLEPWIEKPYLSTTARFTSIHQNAQQKKGRRKKEEEDMEEEKEGGKRAAHGVRLFLTR
jgi:hypothetical protein